MRWYRNQVRSGSRDTTNALASSRSSRIRSEPVAPVSRSASSTVDPVQHRGAQQQALDLRRLPLQHLGQQVLRDRAVAAGELGDELLGVGVPGEG